jgi:hypothetical protein
MGADQLQRGEVCPKAAVVAGEQRQTLDGRMGPDQKIGQRHNLPPTSTAVSQKDLAGEKRGSTRNGTMVKATRRE